MFTICFHNKYHMSSFNGSFVFTTKPQIKYIYCMAANFYKS
jgi:hypothetical protein